MNIMHISYYSIIYSLLPQSLQVNYSKDISNKRHQLFT